MEKFFILKIGGSVATYKDNIEYTVRENTLCAIFTELSKLINLEEHKLIIVHGAGGHVHHLAHKYDLKSGTLGNTEKTSDAIATQTAVTRLHRAIVALGKTCSLPLVSVPTHTVITQKNNKIDTCSLRTIQEAFITNNIPVLYGDMVNDVTLGMSICSGDAITAHLTTLLPITHGFFATDVDGIYTSDPHINSGAELVEEITFSTIDKNIKLTESHNKDTTGGLAGKIGECTDLFTTSIALEELHIFNGMEHTNYRDIFLGNSFPHTKITT